VYLAPLGLWLTLDAGTFESVALAEGEVRLNLSPATEHTPRALLRIEQPAAVEGVGAFRPVESLEMERGAYVVPLGVGSTQVILTAGD
jgi:hypothetical protein